MRDELRTPWGIGAAASLAVPLAAVCIWSEARWPYAMMAGWAIAAALAYIAAERRQAAVRCRRQAERIHQSALRTLSHYRHDWMNELQILYGYLRLQKLDKAIEVVDRIREQMENDSRVSRLGIPALIAFFVSFRSACDTMKLEVSVEDGLQLDRLRLDPDRLTRALVATVNIFRARVPASAGPVPVLRLRFEREEQALAIGVAYEGELAAAESVPSELDKVWGDGMRWTRGGEEPESGSAAERTAFRVIVPCGAALKA